MKSSPEQDSRPRVLISSSDSEAEEKRAKGRSRSRCSSPARSAERHTRGPSHSPIGAAQRIELRAKLGDRATRRDESSASPPRRDGRGNDRPKDDDKHPSSDRSPPRHRGRGGDRYRELKRTRQRDRDANADDAKSPDQRQKDDQQTSSRRSRDDDEGDRARPHDGERRRRRRSRDGERYRDLDRNRDSKRYREGRRDRDRDRDVDRHRNHDFERHRDRDFDRRRDRDRDQYPHRYRGRDRNSERDRGRDRYRDRDRDWDRDGDRDGRERHRGSRDYDSPTHEEGEDDQNSRNYRGRGQSRENEPDFDRGSGRDRERESDRYDGYRRRERHSGPKRSRENDGEEMGHSATRDYLQRSPRAGSDPMTQFRDPDEERRLAAEGQLLDSERDLRTVFIWQLAQKVNEKHVYDLFSNAGKVREVRLIVDKRSNRHKGAGYVEFYKKESVPAAVLLSGRLVCGFPVAVKPSEAEKNIAAQAAAKDGVPTAASSGSVMLATPEETAANHVFTKLYVGSIHFSVTEDDLKAIFSPFGEIGNLSLHKDPDTGRSKGFAFVQYLTHESARKALEQLNGLDLAGRPLKVGLASSDAGVRTTSTVQAGDVNAQSRGITLRHEHPVNELDEGKDGGLALSATQRALLMQRLSRGEISAPKTAAPIPTVPSSNLGLTQPTSGVAALPGYNPPLPTSGASSRCIMLKNLFDPANETDPDFHLEIAEDVSEECAEKYGAIHHIHVDKKSTGIVYVKFVELTSSLKAQQALNGRWFAGHQVTADFVTESSYYQRFSSAQD